VQIICNLKLGVGYSSSFFCGGEESAPGAVISAIGTREYYVKLGYTLEGEYMIYNMG